MRKRSGSFPKRVYFGGPWRWLGRLLYTFKGAWRRIRTGRVITKLLGPQYVRSRSKIEIDITYACNLFCLNCNRSVTQAPESRHMPLRMIQRFVDDSIARGKRWERIRVLGGEPTLHPEFLEIIAELRRYRAWNLQCRIEVVTNGYGEFVKARLAQLPEDIWIEDSAKTNVIQPSFRPFNMAPIDDPAFASADFTNGCAIMDECGMGLTPTGYYPCALAGGIDRVVGIGLGKPGLPDDGDSMLEAARAFCRLCGRFKDGHYIPPELRPALTSEQISPTWQEAYSKWRDQRRGNHEPVSDDTMAPLNAGRSA